MLAQLQLADGEADAARELVAAWSSDLEHKRTPASVQAWVVDALALDQLAEHDEAAASLERALELAEPNGLRSALLDFGRPLQPLLSRHLRRGTAHGRSSASCSPRSTGRAAAAARSRRS